MFLRTTDTLEFSVDAGTDVVFTASAYEDGGSALTYAPNAGVSNGTTPVTIVAAPGSGHRVIKGVTLRNGGTVARVVTLRIDVSGTDRIFLVETLLPDERLTYTEDGGWRTVPRPDRQLAISAYALDILKGGTAAEAAGNYYCYLKDAGYPGAFAPGTPGLAGRTINGTTEGGVPRFVNPTTGLSYLQNFTASGSVAHAMELYDLLWINTGIVVTTTTAQTINSVAFPARDQLGEINGRGCRVGLLVTTATTNAGAIANSTISYTNSDGTAGRTATLTAVTGLQIPATAVLGTIVWFSLAAGDGGVRSIQSITLGTSLVAGAVSLIVARKIDAASTMIANLPGKGVDAKGRGKGPRLYNGTAFFLAYLATSTTTTQAQATLQVEEWS